ncbi:MAG: hypothetical protein JWP44_5020 [Mucilaginibacter sp.]|nr:hypothetical protein [Mucilaginibacter sp.]
MIGTLLLYESIVSYFQSDINLAIINMLAMFVTLILGFTHFKKFNDKNRYIIFLQIKKLLDNEKIDQR